MGLLALNAGIIDSHFEGKISTVIINFSDVKRTIDLDMPFFRVMFFEHKNVTKPKIPDKQSTNVDVSRKASDEFPRNFLNIPQLNDEYYGRQFTKMLWGWAKNHPIFALLIGGGFILNCYGVISKMPQVAAFLNNLGL